MSGSGRPPLTVLKRRFQEIKPPFPPELLAEIAGDPRVGAKSLLKTLQRKHQAWESEQKRLDRMCRWERDCVAGGFVRVAGVDEAGRGPLAGPIVAAAVILPPEPDLQGVDDSKKLTPAQRDRLYDEIREKALGVGIGIVSSRAIDQLGIQQANLRVMEQAIRELSPAPDMVLVDAVVLPSSIGIPRKSIIRGDSASLSIAAASIIAKVTRDRVMVHADRKYPQYAFARHKGYGTAQHLEAIAVHGICQLHRRSFAPVKARV